MQIILLGPPGAGKGTLAKKIKEKKKLTHISTGDLFRKHIKEQTDLGKEADKYIKEGFLVPDELTEDLVRHELEEVGSDFILDGYPRNLEQANALIKMMAELDITLDATIYLDIDAHVIVNRLVNRRTCSNCGALYNLNSLAPKIENTCDYCGGQLIQRSDDNENIIIQRLNVYLAATEPLIEFYEKNGLLVTIDGNKELVEKYQEICEKLAERID